VLSKQSSLFFELCLGTSCCGKNIAKIITAWNSLCLEPALEHLEVYHVAGAGASKLGLRTTVAIVVTRLLVIPPIGIATVLTAEKMGFLPEGNKVFKFVLLLQHTMPSSILAGSFFSCVYIFPCDCGGEHSQIVLSLQMLSCIRS